MIYEPCYEKTGLRGFRPGPTQTGLHSEAKLICVFVFVYAKSRFSHDEAHLMIIKR